MKKLAIMMFFLIGLGVEAADGSFYGSGGLRANPTDGPVPLLRSLPPKKSSDSASNAASKMVMALNRSRFPDATALIYKHYPIDSHFESEHHSYLIRGMEASFMDGESAYLEKIVYLSLLHQSVIREGRFFTLQKSVLELMKRRLLSDFLSEKNDLTSFEEEVVKNILLCVYQLLSNDETITAGNGSRWTKEKLLERYWVDKETPKKILEGLHKKWIEIPLGEMRKNDPYCKSQLAFGNDSMKKIETLKDKL